MSAVETRGEAGLRLFPFYFLFFFFNHTLMLNLLISFCPLLGVPSTHRDALLLVASLT